MDLRELRDDPATWSILTARAHALAAPPTAENAQLGDELLTFRLGDGHYGVSARLVREVHPLGGYTPLPGTPPFVLGLVNLRGRLLVALDLRPLLAFSSSTPRLGAVLLIISANGVDIGLLADEVIEIRRCDSDLSPSLALAERQSVAWVRGVDRDLTVVIDLALLLADPRLVVDAAGERGSET